MPRSSNAFLDAPKPGEPRLKQRLLGRSQSSTGLGSPWEPSADGKKLAEDQEPSSATPGGLPMLISVAPSLGTSSCSHARRPLSRSAASPCVTSPPWCQRASWLQRAMYLHAPPRPSLCFLPRPTRPCLYIPRPGLPQRTRIHHEHTILLTCAWVPLPLLIRPAPAARGTSPEPWPAGPECLEAWPPALPGPSGFVSAAAALTLSTAGVGVSLGLGRGLHWGLP